MLAKARKGEHDGNKGFYTSIYMGIEGRRSRLGSLATLNDCTRRHLSFKGNDKATDAEHSGDESMALVQWREFGYRSARGGPPQKDEYP